MNLLRMRCLTTTLIVILAIGLSPRCHAVYPESGLFVPAEGFSLAPDDGRWYSLDVQDGEAMLVITAYESSTGRGEVYQAQGNIRDDAIAIGALDPPLNPVGFYPLHWFQAELFKVEGGSCIGCTQPSVPPPIRRENAGMVRVYFAQPSSVRIEYFPDGPPGPMVRRNLRRVAFGRDRILVQPSQAGQSPGFLMHDLRGQWVFVDQAAEAYGAVREAVLRFDFSEREIVPEPIFSEPWRVSYFDPGRGAELRCFSPIRVVGGKPSGCELLLAGRTIVSARLEDIGMDRIQAFRGELPPVVVVTAAVSDPYRRPETVIGVRVSVPELDTQIPDPLGAAAAPANRAAPLVAGER
jgi:hypothetical protein